MLNFPFLPFPYNNYYKSSYPHYYKNNGDIQNVSIMGNKEIKKGIKEHSNENVEKKEAETNKDQKRSTKNNSFANINLSAILESDLNTPIIEILGIKLYLDDLIIIGLLFFLYKEDVQDEILFGILLLLLLS